VREVKLPFQLEQPASIIEKRAFLKLPLETRRRILAEQAAKMSGHYEQDSERKDLEGGESLSINRLNPQSRQ
jgi:hypothetical protein